MNDHEFLTAFEKCAITVADFHLADHVRLAWIYLRRYSLLQAIERFTRSLQRFAHHNRAAALYHETVTWAYLFLIHERIQRAKPDLNWEAFRASNSDLFAKKPSIIERYYSHETISSDLARRIFVLPDCDRIETERSG
jgi:hypothetical protein